MRKMINTNNRCVAHRLVLHYECSVLARWLSLFKFLPPKGGPQVHSGTASTDMSTRDRRKGAGAGLRDRRHRSQRRRLQRGRMAERYAGCGREGADAGDGGACAFDAAAIKRKAARDRRPGGFADFVPTREVRFPSSACPNVCIKLFANG